jgi:hypothetical protein
MSLVEPFCALALLVALALFAREKNYPLTSTSLTFVTAALTVLLLYAVLTLGV